MNPRFCWLSHLVLRHPNRSLASTAPEVEVLQQMTYGHTKPRGSNIVAILRRTFPFVVWKSGETREAVTVNKSSVLFDEIPIVFITGSWPLVITISVARSTVGMASITFGELEIHFLACMLAIPHSAFN